MTSSAQSLSHPPHEQPGYVFDPWETVVTPERQAAFHAAVGLEQSVHGDHVDPSVLANDCLHGARPRDALGDKRLHVGAQVKQRRPVRLGTPLTVSAWVQSVEVVPRGRMIAIAFDFEESDGRMSESDAPISILHESLILDPTGAQAAPPKSAKPKPVGEDEDGWEHLDELALTPENVSGYSFEFPHLEGHHSAEAAASIGLRAQIAQGLMLFTAMLGAWARPHVPNRMQVAARFLRPAFADETHRIEGLRSGSSISTVRSLKPDGKPSARMDVLEAKDVTDD